MLKDQYTVQNLKNRSRDDLEEIILNQQNFISSMLDTMASMKRNTYSSKSEKVHPEQLNLFNEIEQTVDEEKEITVKSYTKKANRKPKAENFDGLRTETVYIEEENPICPECGCAMVKIGEEVKEEIIYKPAEIYKLQTVYAVYKCPRCYEEDETFEKVTARNGEINRILEGSIVGASVVSGIAYNKFVLDVPLYRQEMDFKRKEVSLSRQTMSNWLMKCSDLYFEAVYDRMKADLREMKYIHMDETTLKVLEEKDRQKSYMWMAASGKWEEKQIVLYHYNHSREYETIEDILDKKADRYIHSDGYGAYHNSEYGINVGCMAHVRRRFYDAMVTGELYKKYSSINDPILKNKLLEEHPGFKNIVKVVYLIDKLYEIERDVRGKTAKEIYETREEKSKPIFKELFTFIRDIKEDYQYKSNMGKAITYALDVEKYVENYMLDGHLEIDDNRGERFIKPFVMARKNFLFANTTSGAKVSAIYFSIIESAKQNQLDPFKYMEYVLKELSSKGNKEEVIQAVLPYSEQLPEYIRVKNTKNQS